MHAQDPYSPNHHVHTRRKMPNPYELLWLSEMGEARSDNANEKQRATYPSRICGDVAVFVHVV